MPRFHLPLVEPDVRICRIRLSDQKSRFRPRKEARKQWQAYQSQSLVQILVGEPCSSPRSQLVLPPQPLAEPIPRVPIHGTIGLANRTQLEIVRPSAQTLVDGPNEVLDGQVRTLPARHLTDGATNSLHRFLRRSHSKIGALPPKRVAPRSANELINVPPGRLGSVPTGRWQTSLI